MPPVPTKCQPIANDVASLESTAQTLRTDVQTAVGSAAWTKLTQLGLILQQLERKRAELRACVTAHTGDVTLELALIDAGGGGVTGDRVANLWDLSTSPPSRIETVAVQDGSFAFAGPIPAGNVALTVTGADSAGAGPDFRSGSVPAPAAGTSQRVEVVLGPIVKVTPDDLSRWLSQVVFAARRFDTPMGAIEVTVSSLGAALEPDAITLSAVGTVSLVALGGQTSPFSGSVTVGFVPSTAPAAALPVDLKKVGEPEVHVGGPLAAYGTVLDFALRFGLADGIQTQLRDVAQDEIAAAAAQAMSLVHLPPGMRLSVRTISVDSSGITFQPALGAFGTVLSTYQPDPSLLVPV